jgi:hypothetical protein
MIEELAPYYSLLEEAAAGLSGVVYKYTTEDEFTKITSIPELQLVYWSEMVQRLHACACTSILRMKKWCEAANLSYLVHNYFGLCASLRGLIEACADTFFCHGNVLFVFATNFQTITTALRAEASKIYLAEGVEQALMHYVFGRKLSTQEKSTSEALHNARHVQEYLESIGNPAVTELYSDLCQVSHPSMMSLVPFLTQTVEHGLVFHTHNIDDELNKKLLRQHRAGLEKALTFGMTSSLCALGLINEFDAVIVETLQCRDNKALRELERIPLWARLKSAMTTE